MPAPSRGGFEVGGDQHLAKLFHGIERREEKLHSAEAPAFHPVLFPERGPRPANPPVSFEKLRLRRELDAELQPLPPGENSIGMEAGAVLGDIADDAEGGRNERTLIHGGGDDASRTHAREDTLLGRRWRSSHPKSPKTRVYSIRSLFDVKSLPRVATRIKSFDTPFSNLLPE